ncbi:beta-1,4 N-acetylgalactosaminyltransferase 1-like [Ptychodera flava]|uniref:beta-1,4 N-acetylgalactosaminyltransferase 1-like n=1 Tax=Ptychodera flava TaxID=63121 RepID=UPI00396A6D80
MFAILRHKPFLFLLLLNAFFLSYLSFLISSKNCSCISIVDPKNIRLAANSGNSAKQTSGNVHAGEASEFDPTVENSALLDILRDRNTFTKWEERSLRNQGNKFRLKCDCPEPPKWLWKNDVNDRRVAEGRNWDEALDKKLQPMVKCLAMSPLSYVGSGITTEPFQAVPILGLYIHDKVIEALENDARDVHFIVRSVSQLGNIHISKNLAPELMDDFIVEGDGTALLNITFVAGKLRSLNLIIDKLVYKSNSFHVDKYDQLEVNFLKFTNYINVHVRRQPLPDLIDPGDEDDIAAKVTVITKTFERYDCLGRFVKNVRKFYPTVPIIIADDSEFPEVVDEPNVKHFTMPFRDGCFAGRNLALSQVRTKYLVFADDDFVFTTNTSLELMIEKLEDKDLELDIVSAPIEGLISLDYVFKLALDAEQGICAAGVLSSVDAEQREVPGYPQCIWGEMLNNFFMAKTTVLRRIGFDPGFIYAGHEEFWLDAVGKAKSAVCNDVSIGHYRTETEKYGPYRFQSEARRKRDPHLLFGNNLCYWKNWEFEEKPETYT